MLRVAVTGLRGVPATFGGVEHQCEELYSRLARRGHDITIYARQGYVPAGLQRYRGMRIKTLPTIYTKYTEAFVHTLLAVLDIIRSDVQIVHMYGQGPSLLAPLLRLLRPGKKVFFTCGGLDWQRKKWPPVASVIIRLGEHFSARFTHYRITVSRELQRYYRERYGVSSHYIPNGMPAVVRRPAERIKSFGLGERDYFLFVGRLVPEKRIEDIISAYLEAPRSHKLAIVGEGAGTEDYARGLKRMADGCGDVIFPGYQYGEALQELYSNALCFINASEVEGLPLTVLEAMSYGLICLTSRIPAHLEIATMGGAEEYMFPVGDREQLSKLMGETARTSRSDIEGLGRGLSRAVAEHYSWDSAARELESLYRESLLPTLPG